MDCREAIHIIYHYLDGELTDDRRREIQHHLDDCLPCLEAYDFEAELRILIQRKCRDDGPGITDTTRSNHRNLHRIHDLRHERKGSDLSPGIGREKHSAMASGLESLRDYCVTSFRLQPARFFDRRSRGDDARIGSAHRSEK